MRRSKPHREDAAPRKGTFAELERLLRHARAIPLAAPVLLFLGFGLGKATTSTLTPPADAAGHAQSDVRHVPPIQIEALTRTMGAIRRTGQETVAYVSLYRDHVAPVEQVLRRRGVPKEVARRMAWPLVEHATRKHLDPATVASVLLVESEGNPHATSPVGARGLMQVMPSWAGRWEGCGRNLYDIDDNLCTGTSLLAWYMRTSGGDERRALLGYNGCVRGTNTPNCHVYPERIARLRREIDREIQAARAKPLHVLAR